MKGSDATIRSHPSTCRLASGRAIAIAVLAVLAFACTSPARTGPTTGGTEPESLAAVSSDELFELTLGASKSSYRPDEVVIIDARLAYKGEQPVTIFHGLGAGGGPLAFGIQEPVPVEGIGPIELAGSYRLSCNATKLNPGQILGAAFAKSGHAVNDGAPLEALQAWFTDPDLILPVGTWHPSVSASLSLDSCGGEQHQLGASIEITVR